jgi:hypothetical protein
MGYQRVDVRLTNNREIKDAVVFNAEEIGCLMTAHTARSKISGCAAVRPTTT